MLLLSEHANVIAQIEPDGSYVAFGLHGKELTGAG
jgi:hypothetical protein